MKPGDYILGALAGAAVSAGIILLNLDTARETMGAAFSGRNLSVFLVGWGVATMIFYGAISTLRSSKEERD